LSVKKLGAMQKTGGRRIVKKQRKEHYHDMNV